MSNQPVGPWAGPWVDEAVARYARYHDDICGGVHVGLGLLERARLRGAILESLPHPAQINVSNVIEADRAMAKELEEARATIAMLSQQVADKREIIRRLEKIKRRSTHRGRNLTRSHHD